MHWINLSYYFYRQIFWGGKLLKLCITILCLLFRKKKPNPQPQKFNKVGKKQLYLSNFVHLTSDTQFTNTDLYKPCICYYSFYIIQYHTVKHWSEKRYLWFLAYVKNINKELSPGYFPADYRKKICLLEREIYICSIYKSQTKWQTRSWK